MSSGNEVPFLLQFMFGEAAGLAQQAVSERLLRWSQALDDWLAERRRGCVHRTYRGSLTAWKRLLSQCVKTPWEISALDIQAYVEWMEACGLAAGTIEYDLYILSSFYDWCAQQQVDPVCEENFNPAAGVHRRKTKHYDRVKVLNRAEADGLLAILKRDEAIIGKRDYAFVLARVKLGVKLKWLMQLQWGQIKQDERGTWLCWQADCALSACPPEVWEALQAYLEAAGRMEVMRAEDYIFAPLRDPLIKEASGQAGDWEAGRHLKSANMRRNLKQYARLAGIPEEKITLPVLRHTAVYLRLEAGDSVEEIQAFMGTNAQPKNTRAYLRKLVRLRRDEKQPEEGQHPGEAVPGGKQERLPDEGEELPERKPHRYKLGEGIIHGFYTQKQPIKEVLAVLEEDIQGMDYEFIGLRNLARMLFSAHSKAKRNDEAARLGEAYTQAAARLCVIIKSERERGEPSEEVQWVNEFLTMLDNAAAQDNEAADDDGETPSEEFWREFEESDPELNAASRRLTEEIAGLRVVLRQLYDLVMETQEVKALVRYVDLYGRGCTRLARLLKAEKGNESRAADFLRELINETIVEVNREMGDWR